MRTIASVEYLPNRDVFNVRWNDEVDGVIYAHRKSYTRQMKNEFFTEVDDAQKYLASAGWWPL